MAACAEGILTPREATQVMETFAKHLGVKGFMVGASEVFLRALAGIRIDVIAIARQ